MPGLYTEKGGNETGIFLLLCLGSAMNSFWSFYRRGNREEWWLGSGEIGRPGLCVSIWAEKRCMALLGLTAPADAHSHDDCHTVLAWWREENQIVRWGFNFITCEWIVEWMDEQGDWWQWWFCHYGWRTMTILSELELVELCVLGDVLWKRADVDL
jgi:hypothetical protein